MATVRPIRPAPPSESPALHDRAMDNLRFIRDTMAEASAFTAVSGWGMVAAGGIAALVAPLAHALATPTGWILAWTGTALLALGIVAGSSIRKARRVRLPVLGGAGRKFLLCFVPAMAAAAVLTLAFWLRGEVAILPGIWMLLYGAAVTSAGAFSVRAVPVMGLCFLAVGAAAMLVPGNPGDLVMGLAFGGLHLTFGTYIAVKHGG